MMRSPSMPDQVGLLLKEAQSVLHARMDEALRPLGLTVAQYACLEALQQDPGITSSELARRSFVSRQSMNVLLLALTERGLVSRSAQSGPRNSLAVEASATAVTLLESARARVAGVTRTMTSRFDADHLQSLRDALVQCRDALS